MGLALAAVNSTAQGWAQQQRSNKMFSFLYKFFFGTNIAGHGTG
jgi:hypothetical protein